jgi:hypothetical protein
MQTVSLHHIIHKQVISLTSLLIFLLEQKIMSYLPYLKLINNLENQGYQRAPYLENQGYHRAPWSSLMADANLWLWLEAKKVADKREQGQRSSLGTRDEGRLIASTDTTCFQHGPLPRVISRR